MLCTTMSGALNDQSLVAMWPLERSHCNKLHNRNMLNTKNCNRPE